MTAKTPENAIIGSRLRSAREFAGLSQAQVAKMLTVHRPTISEMEAGRRKITAEEMAKLADIYEVNISWIMASDGQSEDDIRFKLAAREFSKLRPEDIDKVLNVLKVLRHGEGKTT